MCAIDKTFAMLVRDLHQKRILGAAVATRGGRCWNQGKTLSKMLFVQNYTPAYRLAGRGFYLENFSASVESSALIEVAISKEQSLRE
mmetsp:Transcript_16356/g.32595  ORF Transcript_16356/g.32595 Transcript_16356/m.32595 type:complete len:87 (+) Transcript_16356:607-867(+)|eukprot:CAMPEP_0171648040 /NCGR_PEP_ID=MMETSP0990-20121206/35863_1 /TAXON_ID=483369 /ORGANISM="non described non described, Strain CCMP2098" /LENGTH=86 /DNA_ID=CAMNT_0012225475 /DNA_START=525 /DNA_END=785 /DNA_ORIENTATION=-